MLLVPPTLDAAWPAIAALGAVGAIVAGPRLARWAAVRLQLLLVHISLLCLSEGGSVFSSWRGVAAWPLVQYELFKLLSLEASHRLDSFGHVDTGGKRGGGRRWWWPFAAAGGGGGMGGGGEMSGGMVIKDLVLVGGGHSHVHVLKMFGMQPQPGVQLTLITRDVDTPYSGMLPGYVAGAYSRRECHIDLARLAAFAGARLIHAEATGVDTRARLVHLAGRPSLPYDVLSINTGSAPRPLREAAVARSADACVTPVKPIDGFCARWDAILARTFSAAANAAAPPVRVVVVGGGAGGVELALAMEARLRRELVSRGRDASALRVSLVSRSRRLMPQHSEGVRAAFERILAERRVEALLGEEVVAIESEGGEGGGGGGGGGGGEGGGGGALLRCASGREVPCDEAIWCTQGGAPPWLASGTPLQLDERGFVAVGETLESVSAAAVFAAGDVAAVLKHPRPKAGVFAVRQGPPLATNLRRKLLGKPLLPFTPQDRFLGIIGTGDGGAVASKGPLCLEAAWLWGLKGWIDRTWMAAYTSGLPQMDAAPDASTVPEVAAAAGDEALRTLSHASMRCGGCGAKVGATVLSRVMARLRTEGHLPEARHHTVLVGLEAPDDCAVLAPSSMPSVHSVDFFRSFLPDPFVFGQVAANHALSDCHAMGAPPAGALAVAVVPYGLETKVEATLFQMMAGACRTLGEAGCALLGGHTCEGAELALGFAVVGYVPKEAMMHKGGMRAGDALLLTKPLGTGVLFAAAMRGAAPGAALAAATEGMVRSNAPAAEALIRHGGNACTDVTGFGLLGHLLEMASASNARVRLRLGDVPILPGVEECIGQGIFSSLQPANLRLRRAISNEAQAVQHPAYPALFDPQTAGGLLSSVPADRAEACVRELRALGYTSAAVIGEVTEVLTPEEACPASLIDVAVD